MGSSPDHNHILDIPSVWGKTSVRLGLLVVLALIPFVAYSVVETSRQSAVRTELHLKQLERAAKVIAGEYQAAATAAQDVLTVLSQVGEVMEGDPAECSRLLTNVSTQFEQYTVFSRVDLRGFIDCTSAPLSEPVDVSRQADIGSALETRKFSFSFNVMDPVTGKPGLAFSLPILDKRGRFIGIANTRLDLDWFGGFLSELDFPPEMGLWVFNGDGILLSTWPAGNGRIGDSVAGDSVVRACLEKRSGTYELEDSAGERVLAAFSEVTGATGRLHIAVITKKGAVMADLVRLARTRNIFIGLLILFSLAAAWVASRMLILQWTGRLSRQAARLAGGDLSARTGISGASSELGILAETFDRMAEQLEEREEALRDSEARARAVVDTAAEGIITIDHLGVIETANRAAESIFGYRESELAGRKVNMLMPEEYARRHDEFIGRYIRTGEKRVIGIGREVEGLRKDGSVIPLELAVSEVRLGERLLFTGILRDITKRKRAEEQLRIQALFDGLTGLLNRRHFMERLEAEIEQARRHAYPLTVGMCDLDHFKSVNDTYGHRAGDEVLRGFGRLISGELRAGDTAGRYGGEEFALVLPHTSARSAGHLLERIRRKLAGINFGGGDSPEFHVTVSVGLAEIGHKDGAELDVLERADKALYQAKKSGRNRVVISGE